MKRVCEVQGIWWELGSNELVADALNRLMRSEESAIRAAVRLEYVRGGRDPQTCVRVGGVVVGYLGALDTARLREAVGGDTPAAGIAALRASEAAVEIIGGRPRVWIAIDLPAVGSNNSSRQVAGGGI